MATGGVWSIESPRNDAQRNSLGDFNCVGRSNLFQQLLPWLPQHRSGQSRSLMPLPNFVIAGAPKAGTTTLYDLLRQHPAVGMSYIKEPNYFSDGWASWARELSDYEALFVHCAGKKAIGEA